MDRAVIRRRGSDDQGKPKLPTAVTYRVAKPRPGTLRLWTIQPPSVWEQLRRNRTLYVELDQVDPDDAHLFDFLDQYDWMREQMARRLPSYGGRYPWWAYLRPKPDLRRRIWEAGPWGTHFVRLELAIESERILLSNVDAWWGRICLGFYVETDEADCEAWEAELERQGLGLSLSVPEPWRARTIASWQRIFDVGMLTRSGRFENEVQATFERLDLADVVAVTEFTARGRPDPAGP